jgi:hypothetical protein
VGWVGEGEVEESRPEARRWRIAAVSSFSARFQLVRSEKFIAPVQKFLMRRESVGSSIEWEMADEIEDQDQCGVV